MKVCLKFQIRDEDKYAVDTAADLYQRFTEDDTPTDILKDNPIIRYRNGSCIKLRSTYINDANLKHEDFRLAISDS
jgi:hypothetical protein